MRTLFRTILIFALVMGAAPPSRAAADTAQGVFDQLKSLAGTWHGEAAGEGEAAAAEAQAQSNWVHEFRVSAAGTVVMETMGPGTDHEMINMYHLDGDDLLVTHYCAGGNQPRMRLNRDKSTSGKLIFDFAGGTNLDPSVDAHIHSAEIMLIDSDHLESAWTAYAGGEETSLMTFYLVRSQ
jgi:hypothetical protein